MKKMILILSVLLSLNANAAATAPRLVYDLGISTGTYNGSGYSEVHFGLNWRLLENLVWRNTAYTRLLETSSTAGLDSSFRAVFDTDLESGGLTVATFAGPGYRFSRKELSGPFVEAGAMLRGSGFGIGVGAKSIFYTSPTKYSNGDEAPKNDNVIFIILAAGGGI